MKIDNQISKPIGEHNRGIYGIFIIPKKGFCCKQCAYIGKSEQLSVRAEQHLEKLLNREHVPLLNRAMDDELLRIEIRLIEIVPYKFDNYYKDAQRLASRENYWIDKYQKKNQCIEQVPSGKRPSIEWWEKQKIKLMK